MDREANKTQMRFQSFDRLAKAIQALYLRHYQTSQVRRLPRRPVSTQSGQSGKGCRHVHPHHAVSTIIGTILPSHT